MPEETSRDPGKRGGPFFSLLKGLCWTFALLAGLEAALRVAGVAYSRSRPSSFGTDPRPWPSVLCVGDSYTFGGNVAGGQAYPAFLYGELRGKFPRLRVVNDGHCEYNSSQTLYALRQALAAYSPQIVVVLVGSSDRWNLIGTDPRDPARVFRPDYERSVESLPGPPQPGGLRSLRLYKMARAVILNIELRILLRDAGRMGQEAILARYGGGPRAEQEMAKFMEALYYSGRYVLLIETAVGMLERIPETSPFYSRDFSYYFCLASAFSLQSKYPASYAAGRFRAVLEKRPDLAGNEVFMKYDRFFRDKEAAEAAFASRLDSNLDAMVALVKARGAVPVLAGYPITHSAAAAALRRAAERHSLHFVDLQAAFAALLAKEPRSRYFMGDDHATPEGHREMARRIAPVIEKVANDELPALLKR